MNAKNMNGRNGTEHGNGLPGTPASAPEPEAPPSAPLSPLGLMKGRRGLVVGVANRWSLAWAVARALHREGAQVALSYQNERLGRNVKELAPELGEPPLIPLDVTSDKQILVGLERLRQLWGSLDFLVHAVAFAPRSALEGSFVETSREDFRSAHDVSAYSLPALVNAALPFLNPGASILTLSYLGSSRVVPNYNVMGVAKASLEASVRYLAWDLGEQGIRVNALSPGPIKTLAASGISGIGSRIREHRHRSPLRKDTDPEEVADAALFLLGPRSRGITGQVLYVDGGFSIMAD